MGWHCQRKGRLAWPFTINTTGSNRHHYPCAKEHDISEQFIGESRTRRASGASMRMGHIDIRRVPRPSNAEVSYVVEAI
jgi:hypothetical protein